MNCADSIARVDASLARVQKYNQTSATIDAFSIVLFLVAAVVAGFLITDLWPPRVLAESSLVDSVQ